MKESSEAPRVFAPSRATCGVIAIVSVAHAALFAWAGTALPWSDLSAFAVASFVLAFAHLATAVAAAASVRAAGFPELRAIGFPALRIVWRVASVLSLLALAWVSFEIVRSAAYLAELYGGLGEGIGAALLAAIGLFALVTLPLAAWGLAATAGPRDGRRVLVASALVAAALAAGSAQAASSARGEPLPASRDQRDQRAWARALDEARRELLPSLDALPAPREGARLPTLYDRVPVACPPVHGEASAVVAFLGPRDVNRVQAVRRCVRAAPEDLARAVVERVRDEALRGPIVVDVFAATAPLRPPHRALEPLALRPGLDGVCDEARCLLPHQLVAGRHFVASQPIPEIPDFRFGVSPARLHAALGVAAEGARAEPSEGLDELTRLETHAFVLDDEAGAVMLVRGREREVKLTRARLDRALALAERHVVDAQFRQGRFRYLLDPHTGRGRSANWNLPRQAGTTLALCELGTREEETRDAARRALAFMARYAHASGELVTLAMAGETHAGLGSIALPAIAFFACRARVGDAHDAALAGMARSLLAMQRDDGGFHPYLERATSRPVEGPEPLYAGGQAIFALSLAEKLALDEPSAAEAAGLPSAEVLGRAVTRAMDYYAGPYWGGFVRDFFWIEENWHCLAARASLAHHRHDAYERFCLDYVAFKSRVILDEESRVADELVGGYSMGNVFVPQNTPTAGFGEALAAAISVAEARGLDTLPERARMKLVLEHLVRQQWDELNCAHCAPGGRAIGGFSESMANPEIRIDYTQHAWAALGHGGAWIRDELPES